MNDDTARVEPKSAGGRARDCVEAFLRWTRRKPRPPLSLLLSRLEGRIGIHLEAFARQEKGREGDKRKG